MPLEETHEISQGPCFYCGDETERTASVPNWSRVDQEGTQIWFCGKEECQELFKADPYNDWTAYWASI